MIRTIRFLPLLLVASAAFLAAAGANQQPAAGAQAASAVPVAPQPDYFPLAPGNAWSYAITAGGTQIGTEDVRVVPVATNVAGGLDNYFGNGALSVVHETGIGTVVEGPAGTMLWYALSAPVGTRWRFHSSTAPGGWNNILVTLLSRTEVVDVPAGHFDNCVKLGYLRLSGNGPGPVEEVFAPGVGLVRRVEFAVAPRTWELASGTVGGRRLPLLPIEVSIGLNRDAVIFAGPYRQNQPPVKLRVRLTVKSEASPETFHFLTTQRFDVRVRDVTGQEIWLWSRDTGQSFQPVPGDETAGPGQPLVYEVEFPVVQGGVQGRFGVTHYQIEAILWNDQAAQGVEGRMARTMYTVINAP